MMDDLLKALLEGTQAQQPAQQPEKPTEGQGTDILSNLLQGVLGGGAAPQQQAQQPNALNIADLLGAVLGGGQAATPAQTGMNSLAAPIANILAEKLGISPQIAQMVVTFAMAALLSKGKERGNELGSSRAALQGVDFDELLESDFVYRSGMAGRLSQESGLSEDEAATSLYEAMMLLSGHSAHNPSDPPNDQDA